MRLQFFSWEVGLVYLLVFLFASSTLLDCLFVKSFHQKLEEGKRMHLVLKRSTVLAQADMWMDNLLQKMKHF